MDSSQSSDSQPHGLSRQASYSTITAAHLAAAIASASGASSAGSGENAAITSEMFNQAMQRTLSSIAANPTSQDSPVSGSGSGSAGTAINLERQMQQMRELGLTDDALNLHVLQLTGGNVHDAIDLVFSGTAPPP